MWWSSSRRRFYRRCSNEGLNSRWLPVVRDGHQACSRGLYTHGKDSLLKNWDDQYKEFRHRLWVVPDPLSQVINKPPGLIMFSIGDSKLKLHLPIFLGLENA